MEMKNCNYLNINNFGKRLSKGMEHWAPACLTIHEFNVWRWWGHSIGAHIFFFKELVFQKITYPTVMIIFQQNIYAGFLQLSAQYICLYFEILKFKKKKKEFVTL